MGHPTAEVSERVRAKLRVAELGRALEARLSGTYWDWGPVVILGGRASPTPGRRRTGPAVVPPAGVRLIPGVDEEAR
ncbi:MAG: hypothetical protein M3R02_26895 [Chloroflexota bacterium]|nr:hypothetical protein [Chloroflexota bacterium]